MTILDTMQAIFTGSQMTTINELTTALRKAANDIEKAAKFNVGEDVDLAEGVAIVRGLLPKHTEAKIHMAITIPGDKDDPVTVEYLITESFRDVAKASSFHACLEAYMDAKETKDHLGAVARLVKKVCLETPVVAIAVDSEIAPA